MRAVASMILLAGCCALLGCSTQSEKVAQAAKPPVAVETAVATATDLVEGIDITGALDAKFATDVKTQIPGLVKQVYVTEWVRVHKGQLLARIDVSETEAMVKRAEASVASARAALAQATAGRMRAEREQARLIKLKEAGLATQQAVDDARTELEASLARAEAGKAQIAVAEEEVRQARARMQKGVVTAPIDGVVALRDVNVGDLASDAAASKPIFRIVDNRLLNLTVTVSSADAARVKVGQSLEFSVDSLPGRTFSGKVMYINPELNPADRSLKVIAEVRNVPEVLKGGLFAKGRIVTGTRRGVVLLPRLALATWDTATRAATVLLLEGNVARKRTVTTGMVNGDQVEIVSGLTAGERYIVRGGFNLKDGDKVINNVPATQAKEEKR